jgi:hypothetical protein
MPTSAPAIAKADPFAPAHHTAARRASDRAGATVPTILPAYAEVVRALTPMLHGLPGVIVTIDGRDASHPGAISRGI